jgi:hypothetical protein
MAVKAVLKPNNFGNEVRVKTGKVRLSFPHLFEKYEKSDKYQAVFMIPKGSDTQRIVDEAVSNAKKDGKARLWGGKIPGKLGVSIKDGDEPNEEGDTYPENEGHILLTAKSTKKPPVFDADGNDVFDAEELYSGCYVQAIFDAYPYANDSKGVGFSLAGVKKIADGEPLGGNGYKASANDFDDAEDEDDDDGLLS